jgi:hypothetical protein
MSCREPIKDEEIPQGADRCPMCEGYRVMVQAPLSRLPIEHATSGLLIRCPCCYGMGWRVVLMEVTVHHDD